MRWMVVLAALVLAGCGFSWFQGRVEAIDARMAAAQLELAAAETQEERAKIEAQLEALAEERRQAMGGALQESENKKALLMALISLGAGGLKLAGGMAAKGAGGAL